MTLKKVILMPLTDEYDREQDEAYLFHLEQRDMFALTQKLGEDSDLIPELTWDEDDMEVDPNFDTGTFHSISEYNTECDCSGCDYTRRTYPYMSKEVGYLNPWDEGYCYEY